MGKFPKYGNSVKLLRDKSSFTKFIHLSNDDKFNVNGVCNINNFKHYGWFTNYCRSTILSFSFTTFLCIFLYHKDRKNMKYKSGTVFLVILLLWIVC